LNLSNLSFDVADQTVNLYSEGKLVIMFGRQNLIDH
jgi:hypothetical protein